jgi:hypothetical protein
VLQAHLILDNPPSLSHFHSSIIWSYPCAFVPYIAVPGSISLPELKVFKSSALHLGNLICISKGIFPKGIHGEEGEWTLSEDVFIVVKGE